MFTSYGALVPSTSLSLGIHNRAGRFDIRRRTSPLDPRFSIPTYWCDGFGTTNVEDDEPGQRIKVTGGFSSRAETLPGDLKFFDATMIVPNPHAGISVSSHCRWISIPSSPTSRPRYAHFPVDVSHESVTSAGLLAVGHF